MGVSVIEKHVTLSQNLYGPDHSSSLNVYELKNFVESIKSVNEILGEKKIKRSSIEEKNKMIVRKSLVANKEIKKGEIFTRFNLTCKRPGTGLSPYFLKKLIGKKSKFHFKENQFIKI